MIYWRCQKDVPDLVVGLWVEACGWWNAMSRRSLFRPAREGDVAAVTVKMDPTESEHWAGVATLWGERWVYVGPKFMKAAAPLLHVRRCNVLKHEAGHLLGLPHSDAWNSVMAERPENWLHLFRTGLPYDEKRAFLNNLKETPWTQD